MKFGHAAAISHAISALQEMNGEKVVKGLNKDQARMVHSINKSLGIYENPTGNFEDDFIGSLDKTQIWWIKDRLNEIFDSSKMPIWASKWALEILDWEVK